MNNSSDILSLFLSHEIEDERRHVSVTDDHSLHLLLTYVAHTAYIYEKFIYILNVEVKGR